MSTLRLVVTPLFAVVALALAAGCSSSGEFIPPDDPAAGGDDKATDPGSGPACFAGRSYTGFGGTVLSDQRADAPLGIDRGRVKPYSALGGEFTRVLGKAPASLTSEAATFNDAPARWFVEPQAGAMSLYTSYRIAFEGCREWMNGQAQYSKAPTADSAKTECTTMERKFWSRVPSPEEIDACSTLATSGLSSEADAANKWANTCAAVMTSSGFVTF